MSDVFPLVLKALASGALVVVFSLVSEAVRPKSFAGLFGAAPSIAVVGLIITVTTKGVHSGHEQAFAMVFGAIALAAYCVTAAIAVKRVGALRGSVAAFAAWFAVAGASLGLVLR